MIYDILKTKTLQTRAEKNELRKHKPNDYLDKTSKTLHLILKRRNSDRNGIPKLRPNTCRKIEDKNFWENREKNRKKRSGERAREESHNQRTNGKCLKVCAEANTIPVNPFILWENAVLPVPLPNALLFQQISELIWFQFRNKWKNLSKNLSKNVWKTRFKFSVIATKRNKTNNNFTVYWYADKKFRLSLEISL